MASDPALSRPQMITFCEKEANEWERFARLGCYKQDVTWPTTRAAMFRAIVQALQGDEPSLRVEPTRKPYSLSHITCTCGHTSAGHANKLPRKCMVSNCLCEGYSGDTPNMNDMPKEG